MTVGANIKHYKILKRIGEGGMGVVYKAEDTKLHRDIALKLLSEEFTKDENRVRRFQQEARAASNLNHPNIITIFEIGEEDSLHFIATEFIEGETLRERMNREPLGIREAIDIAIQIAKALAVAHARGIIHRDIKPENIMVRPDGYIKVLDFGLAKLTEKSGEHDVLSSDPDAITKSIINTNPGIVMGTVSYMSPEQARGVPVDARTDTFSLGIVLYEMVSGRKPFEANTISDVIALILYKEPPPLARFLPGAPVELERIVHKALSKDREERYQTVKDVAIDLRRLMHLLDVEAELERSRPSGFRDEVTITTIPPRKKGSGEQQAGRQSGGAATTILEPGAVRPTSSAEYIVGEIKRHKKSAAFTVTALLIAIACFTYFIGAGESHTINTMAVLPFDYRSNDASTEYLSDVFTENLISSLSRVPTLRVKAYNLVNRFKNQQVNPQTVGKELGVHAVLMGKIEQHDNSLVVKIELIDAEDSFPLWTNQYNAKFSEILLVHEEITSGISEKLHLELNGEDQRRLEALQLYLKGRSHWNKRTTDEIKRGKTDFERATEKDPKCALAYAGLADCYNMLALYSAMPPQEGSRKAKEAAERALKIDDSLSEAHTSMAFVLFRWDREWEEAEKEFNRAIGLNGKYAPAYQWYANYLVAMGNKSKAIAQAKITQQLDPFSLINRANLAWVYYFAHQYTDAIKSCEKLLETDPEFFIAHRYLGLAYEQTEKYPEAIAEFQKAAELSGNSALMRAHLGHAYAVAKETDKARKILDDLKEQASEGYIPAYNIAVIYAGLGETDQAFIWLDKACDENGEFLVYLKVDPRLDKLRADPRFPALLRRVGLP